MQKGIKKNVALVFLFVFVLMGAVFFAAGPAAQAQPGSESDPLVTRSYVNGRIAEAISGGAAVDQQAIVNAVLAQMGGAGGEGGGAAAFQPVFASAGTVIIGHEGTEIILRSGSARVRAQGQDGLADITAGAELLNGADVSPNHMMLVSRHDGRGVTVQNDAWLLIKGGYTRS